MTAVACVQATPVVAPGSVHIQYSFAAQPWLGKVSNCAGVNIVTTELHAADFQDPQVADMIIRLGEPDNLPPYTFLIGTDDLLIIANAQNPVETLTAEQVRELFTGEIQNWKTINGSDAQVQIWVFPTGEDVQQIFERTVLYGIPLMSSARLANSPDEMEQAIEKDVNAIGIITRRLKAGNVSEVFTAASNLPVLAISQNKPQGYLERILACLQK